MGIGLAIPIPRRKWAPYEAEANRIYHVMLRRMWCWGNMPSTMPA